MKLKVGGLYVTVNRTFPYMQKNSPMLLKQKAFLEEKRRDI